MNKSSTLIALISSFFLSSLTLSSPATAKLYKWVDDNGVTHYGETIPPEYANKDRVELNKAGREVNRKEILTPEELRKKKEDDERLLEEQKAARERQRHDKTLLSTYSNVEEIDLARGRSLQQIDSHINSIHSQLKIIDDNLTGWKKEAKSYTDSNKPIPPSLHDDINETRPRRAKLQKTLDKLEKEKAAVEKRYDEDKARYRQLTGK